MKAIALTALSVLIALPAEAATRHQVNGSSTLTCNNDGRCTTFNVTAPTLGLRKTRPAFKKAAVASSALDANGKVTTTPLATPGNTNKATPAAANAADKPVPAPANVVPKARPVEPPAQEPTR